jgi:hypothetical protein
MLGLFEHAARSVQLLGHPTVQLMKAYSDGSSCGDSEILTYQEVERILDGV